VRYPGRVDACGKEVFAIRGQFQAVAGGWEVEILYELDTPPERNSIAGQQTCREEGLRYQEEGSAQLA